MISHPAQDFMIFRNIYALYLGLLRRNIFASTRLAEPECTFCQMFQETLNITWHKRLHIVEATAFFTG